MSSLRLRKRSAAALKAPPFIELIRYGASGAAGAEISRLESPEQAVGTPEGKITWVNVEGLGKPAWIEAIGKAYGLHPLVIEDSLHVEHRPKLEDYGDYLYIVLKMLSLDAHGGVVIEHVSLALGRNFVVTFQEGLQGDVFDRVRKELQNGGRLHGKGADFLAYELIDAIVDNYFSVLERLGDRIDELETMILRRPSPAILTQVHSLRRDMVFLRRSVWPVREVVAAMSRQNSTLVASTTELYLRDVYDHAVQAIDAIETYRDVVGGLVDLHLSTVSNRTNEIMKVLTLISTIFLPLSFIAGVYGMNFKHMPELEWMYGYPVALLIMTGIAGGFLVFFRRKKFI